MKPLIIIFLLPFIFAFSPVATPTEKGIDAFSAGKYGDALSDFGKAAKDNPDKPEAHINLGDALYKNGEFDKAAKEYSEAARLQPKMHEAWYNMGDAYYRMGAYDKALSAFQKAGSLKNEADTKHNIEVTMEKVKKEQVKKDQQRGQGSGAGGQQDKKGPGAGNQNQPGQATRNNQPGQERNQQRQGGQGQSSQGQNGQGQGGQGQAGQGQSGQAAQGSGGQGGAADSEVSRMLAKQREQEKSLRRYFRPGEKDSSNGSEDEIEQMLRGMGVPVPRAKAVKPGAPYVEKDW
jgi:Ca-activated chloride channel family protein